MYSAIVIDHFTNPRNVGTIKDPDGYAQVRSPGCGDVMELYLRIQDDAIVDARYRAFGCAAAIASSSVASELIKGQTLEQAAQLTDEHIAAALGGLPAEKLHCSVLAASALHTALEDYYARQAAQHHLDQQEN